MATIKVDRNASVQTIHAAALNTATMTKTKFPILENSTVNEALEVTAVPTDPTEIQQMNFFMVGSGGITSGATSAGTRYIPHQPIDANLYSPQLPFIFRTLDNDLTPSERTTYAMRKIHNISGTDYVGYYCKKIDFSTVETSIEEVTPLPDGTTEVKDLILTADSLNPLPTTPIEDQINPETGTYVRSVADLILEITPVELQEMSNALSLIYGWEDDEVLSEVSIVSSSTDSQTLTDGSVFNEASEAQILTFVPIRENITNFITGSTPLKIKYRLTVDEPITLGYRTAS